MLTVPAYLSMNLLGILLLLDNYNLKEEVDFVSRERFEPLEATEEESTCLSDVREAQTVGEGLTGFMGQSSFTPRGSSAFSYLGSEPLPSSFKFRKGFAFIIISSLFTIPTTAQAAGIPFFTAPPRASTP